MIAGEEIVLDKKIDDHHRAKAWDPVPAPRGVSGREGIVHRFLGTDHLRWIHVIHDDLYPGL
jgi:hypothetical protein